MMRRVSLLLSLSLSLLMALAVSAQQWRGEGRVAGVVVDAAKEEPIASAQVTLTPEATAADGGPDPVNTNAQGRWSMAGLAPGRYSLTIRAEGFIDTSGWVTVSASTPSSPVEAQMLPLDWRPPAFTEGGSRTTILQWVEKGNSLLAQGRLAEARAEFERALGQLPLADRPRVLSGIARTHFLENEPGKASRSLEEALRLAPADTDIRQLYSVLMGELGRSDEAAGFLAELDENPPSAAEEPGSRRPASQVPEPVRRILEAPIEQLQAHRTGELKVRLDERSPLSDLRLYAERGGVTVEQIRAEDADAGDYSLASESFQLYVPETYSSDRPHALLVWVSPTPFGGTLQKETLDLLAERDVIWVGAHRSGNQRPVWDRVGLALDAAHNLPRYYTIDPHRIYVAGYSGGGRVASRMGTTYAEVFRGAFSVYGCDYYESIPVPERPGTSWPPKYPAPARKELKQLKKDGRFVLLSGPRDFNFTQTRATARRMQADGFRNVFYLEIPQADHYTWPSREWWGRALDALAGGAR